jgi:hypothetical protein
VPAKASSSSGIRTSTSSATSGTRSTAPSASQGHDNSKSLVPSGVAAKPVTTTSSTGRSSDIKCHRCQGLGHIQRDCPSKWAYIATGDGGNVSASDVEDEDIVGANIAETYDGDEEVLGTTATETYKALIVQRALTATASDDDNRQRHNLFNMFLIVKDCRVHTIIDGGSCNNLVNVELVKKLALTTREHPHPYHIQWFNSSGKFKVTKTARVHFSIGSYHDFADFDVVIMHACSLLLGRPWEFDTDAINHGRSNKYTFIHKGKKIVLLPMTPTEMVHFEHEKKINAKQKGVLNSENQQPIKLKTPTLLAIKSDLDELHASVGLCYALVCKNVFYSIDDTSIALPPAIANLLQEYMDVFPSKIPPGLPPELPLDFWVSSTFNILDFKPNMGDEDEIELRMTPIQEEEDDEDITSIHTMNGPITRSSARHLNLQLHSTLVNCVLELTLGPMDVLMIRYLGEDQQGLGKGQGVEEEQQGRPQQEGDQVQLGCDSISGSRTNLH